MLKFGLLGSQIPDDIEIRDCRLSNFRYGIYVESGTNLVVRDNDSSENYDDTDPVTRSGIFLGMVEGGGIRLDKAQDALIVNNTANRQAIGIEVRDSRRVVVSGNTSSDNSAWGIHLIGTQQSQVSGNTVADNIRSCTWGSGAGGWGCDAAGIMLQGGASDNVIENNQVIGKNGNGIFVRGQTGCGNDNVIAGNTIASAAYNAIEVVYCPGTRIEQNNIRDGLDGVWLGFAQNTRIAGNTISDTRNHGIIAENCYDTDIVSNIFVNNREGLFMYSKDYDRAAYGFLSPGDYRSNNNSIRGNTFQGSLYAAIHLAGSTNDFVDNNTFFDNGRDIMTEAY